MTREHVEQKVSAITADPQGNLVQLAEDLQRMLGNWLTQHRQALSKIDDEPAFPQIAGNKSQRLRKPVGISIDRWTQDAYAERRLRDEIFDDPSIFGEPAWDILLDIASAEASGVRLQVSSACIGSCVPPTTALRWISILEKRGLIRRETDLNDARRNFLRLTHSGATKIERYFDKVAERRAANSRKLIR